MRRLTLAALSAALVLTACSDQSPSPTEPDVPPPAETFGTTCTVTRFPLHTALNQIKTVFPTARLRLEASLRAGAIALLWNTCHEKLAQKAALEFVKWMGRQTLPTTDAAKQAQTDLIVTILSGVGLLDLPPDASGGDDFGIGLYDPTKTTPQVFETNGGTALTELLSGAFSEFTVIVISRRPDGSDPFASEPGNHFPPFFDYDAINASGNHFFENGERATITFCQLPEEGFEYPEFEDIKIGHNKPEPDPGFEALDPVVREDLDGILNCENLKPTLVLSTLGGFQSFARTTGRSLAPIARALFMPTALQATTTAVGYLGPISTKPGSFSPFGIVDAGSTETGTLEFAPDGDPGSPFQRSFEDGALVSWNATGCEFECATRYPTVRLVDGEGLGIAGVPIVVSLVPQEGLGGSFGEGSTTSVTTSYGEGDDGTGYAEFSDLVVNLASDESGNFDGLFNLVFSAEGVAPISSGTFRVAVF